MLRIRPKPCKNRVEGGSELPPSPPLRFFPFTKKIFRWPIPETSRTFGCGCPLEILFSTKFSLPLSQHYWDPPNKNNLDFLLFRNILLQIIAEIIVNNNLMVTLVHIETVFHFWQTTTFLTFQNGNKSDINFIDSGHEHFIHTSYAHQSNKKITWIIGGQFVRRKKFPAFFCLLQYYWYC